MAHFFKKKLKDILMTCLKTLKYLLPISKVPHSIFLLNLCPHPGLSFFLSLSSEHWAFVKVQPGSWALSLATNVLSASWLMPAQFTPNYVTSTLFSHSSSSPVVFNSCRTFPLHCSIFSLQINTCQSELILLLPSKLAQHAQFLSFINNTNISPLGQAWKLHQHRCSLSFIAHGNQSLWLSEIILWKDSSSYAFSPTPAPNSDLYQPMPLQSS